MLVIGKGDDFYCYESYKLRYIFVLILFREVGCKGMVCSLVLGGRVVVRGFMIRYGWVS